MGQYRYKLIVGDNLEVAYAGDGEQALTLANKLAFKYRGEVVVALDTYAGSNAFTRLAPLNCPACQD